MTASSFPATTDNFADISSNPFMNDPARMATAVIAHLQNASRALQNAARSFDERRLDGSDFHGSAANLSLNSCFGGSTGINSGTNTTAPAAGDYSALHPGIMLLRSSGTANSGYRIATSGLLIGAANLSYRAIFMPKGTLAGATYYLGIHNTAAGSTAEPTSGCYLAVAPGGVATFKAANAGARTNAASTITLAASVWYTLDITWTTSSVARCVIRNDAGTVLLDVNVSSNVPNTSAQLLTPQFIAISSTINTDICCVDGVWFGPARPAAMAFPS